MAKREDWSEQRRKIEDEKANRRLNIVLRSQEKEEQKAKDWTVEVPQDANYTTVVAPTESAETKRNPRARTIAYNSQTKTLVIVFWDNTWWQYDNVPTELWLGLKTSPSTGKYLHKSGLNNWPNMGIAKIDEIPSSVKAQISQSSMSASRLTKRA